MNSRHQAPGTINLETQEESAISKDPQVTHESNLEEEDPRMSLDAASPATGPGPADMMAESKAAAGTVSANEAETFPQ